EARAGRPRRARRLGPTGHRLGTGPPRARGRAGVVEHVLLRNADAPAAGGDLALLDARDQKRREACVSDVRELALPPDVLVAGRKLHPRRGCETRVRAAAVSTVRRHAECPPCLLSPERGLIAHGPVAHTKDPQAERVQTPGPDHFRRRRSFPEQRCRPDVPRVPPGLRTIPNPGCSTLRPTGRARAGSAVNLGHARAGEYAGLMPVTNSATEPDGRLASVCRSHPQGDENLPTYSAGSHDLLWARRAAGPAMNLALPHGRG